MGISNDQQEMVVSPNRLYASFARSSVASLNNRRSTIHLYIILGQLDLIRKRTFRPLDAIGSVVEINNLA
jgi:hypothetical protein